MCNAANNLSPSYIFSLSACRRANMAVSAALLGTADSPQETIADIINMLKAKHLLLVALMVLNPLT